MNVAIIGSRSFGNLNHYFKMLSENIEVSNSFANSLALEQAEKDYTYFSAKLKGLDISHIISGGAQGADSCAERYAKENNLPITIYYACWEEYGKSAGYKRNIKIVDDAELIVAFWDGVSKGTKHSIDYANKEDKKVIIFQDWSELYKSKAIEGI